MSVEKTNIFGEDEPEMGSVVDFPEEREEGEANQNPEIGHEPQPGLEERQVPARKKKPELPPSMRIIPDKPKGKKPERPN